jgi:hypothetical protein
MAMALHTHPVKTQIAVIGRATLAVAKGSWRRVDVIRCRQQKIASEGKVVGLTAKEKRQRDKDVGRPKRETTSAEERDKPVQEDPPPFDESDVTEICALSCFGWGMSGRSFCWRLLFSVCVCGLRGVAGPFGCHLSSIRALLLAVCALLLAVCFFSEWSGLVGVDWLTVVLFCCLVLDNRRCCAESRPASVDPWAEVGEVRHCRICVADQRLACG